MIFGCAMADAKKKEEERKRREEEERKRQDRVKEIFKNPENKTRFFRGPLQVSGAPADPDFGIITYNSLSLRREVEVFQWRESCTQISKRLPNGKVKTGKSYKYTAEWSRSFSPSHNYADPNYRVNVPPSKTDRTFHAQHATVGDRRKFSVHELI